LTLRGFEVRFFSRSAQRLAPTRKRGGIELRGVAGEGFAEVACLTSDLAEAVEGADLVMLVVPAPWIGDYAERLAAVLGDSQPIFVNPGQTGGGLALLTGLRRAGFEGEAAVCEVSTLAYTCRVEEPGSVRISNVVPRLPFAAVPGRRAIELHRLVSELYPSIELRRNVLETGFANLNAVEHPPQALLNIGWIEYTSGNYFFYHDGTTPSVGRVIDEVDEERIAIAEAMGIEVSTFVEAFASAGYTTESAARVGKAYEAMQASEPNRRIKAPPSLDHRYVHEDVGFGLVPWVGLAAISGVPTPTMDALITIASVANGRDYHREGLTLEKMGLGGIRMDELEGVLREGLIH
jgi:opine dehydrogenase